MKISIRDQVIEFRLVGIYQLADGEAPIRADGYWYPAPHTEAKLGWSMDFDEAQSMRDQLTAALESTPCPHCKRKGRP